MKRVIDRDGFRANVGIILCNDERRLLLGKRVGNGGWQFPQGGMAAGESLREALYRELKEETGLGPDDVEELGRTRKWLRYRLPPKYRRPGSTPQCVGQKQIWFLLRLVAADEAVRLDAGESPEFEDWRWVEYWTPAEEVIFFKRKVYGKALKELEPLLP